MTREEAIKVLKMVECHGSLTQKAKEMAISSLSENKGEWIPKERATECSIDIDIVCSECGYVGIKTYAHGYELNEINIQKVRDYIKELDMNFCTCCGADMRGGEQMSDTVKLVIEIPREKLNIIKNKMYCGVYDYDLYKAIADGTPLDDVKAEIEKQIKRDFAFAETETFKVPCHYGIANGLQVATRIIDNICKAEREET